jgi:hypothetical protein
MKTNITDLIGMLTFRFLEVLIVLAVLGFVITLLFVPIPAQNKDAVLILLGVFATALTGIAGYEWGSSRSSDKKTDIMANTDATTKQTTETTTTKTDKPAT